MVLKMALPASIELQQHTRNVLVIVARPQEAHRIHQVAWAQAEAFRQVRKRCVEHLARRLHTIIVSVDLDAAKEKRREPSTHAEGLNMKLITLSVANAPMTNTRVH